MVGMDDVTTIDNACEFCRRALPTEPYVIRNGFGELSAFHIRCKEFFDGYLMMKNQHDGLCHLEGCTKGPIDPFQFP